jgi:CRP/FNR family cyclic AMP-dependent transcriptional regulator
MKPAGDAKAGPPGNQSAIDDSAAAWKAHPFLQGLQPGHLAILTSCAMPTHFAKDQLIFREGEMANRFYLILQGRVSLGAEAPDRPPVPVEQVAAGDVLGWSWMFPPYTWNFTARTVEPVQAIFFYGTWLREQCDADAVLGYELMKRTAAVAIRRLHAARQELVVLAGRHGVV